jgi:AcrR family transcriptional regulator
MAKRGVEESEGDLREVRGDRTARALLAAAKAVFARRGYAGASVREIAKRARANPALVRYHFESKEGLYRQVVEDALAGLVLRLVTAYAQGDSPAARARNAVLAYLDHLASDRDFPRIVQRALLDGDRRLVTALETHLAPLLATARKAAAQRADVTDVVLSLFGAAVAPFLYAPVLTSLLGEDTLAPAAIERRRAHLAWLAEILAGAPTRSRKGKDR